MVVGGSREKNEGAGGKNRGKGERIRLNQERGKMPLNLFSYNC